MPAKVSFFATCVVDQLFPKVGIAIVDILERLGYQVDFPVGQTCCGQPAFNSGYWEPAREIAEHFLQVFAEADYIVTPSGSCTAMITHHFEEMLARSPKLLADVHRIAPKVWEFSKFLLEVAQVDDLGARFDGIVTYHDGCHSLRELGIKAGPRRLLSKIRGLTLREMTACEECCGFGGTFSVKFPEVSGGMARTKIDSLLATRADVITSTDPSCLMQLQGVLDRAGIAVKTMHLAELLNSR